jgi:predicted dehydrogenase
VIDLVQLSLGEIAQFQSLLANQRKSTDLIDRNKEVVKRAMPSDTADHIFLHGFHTSGAAFSLSLRAGKQLDPAEPLLRWNIYGTKGQIEITSFSSVLNLSFGANKVRVKGADGNISEEVLEKGSRANVEGLYEAFALGDKRVASFADAVERHRFLEVLYGGKQGQPVIFTSRT